MNVPIVNVFGYLNVSCNFNHASTGTRGVSSDNCAVLEVVSNIAKITTFLF